MRAALLVLVPALLAAPVTAVPPSASMVLTQAEQERKVSLDLDQVPLRQAVALLFDGSSAQFSIDPNVPDIPVTLHIRDVSLPAGLRLLIRQAATVDPELTSVRDGEVYLIKKRPRPGMPLPVIASIPEPARERLVTLNLRDVPLRSAVQLLFRGSSVQFTISPRVPNVPVNLTLKEITLQQAFRLLIRQAHVGAPGLTSYRDGEVISIRMLSGY